MLRPAHTVACAIGILLCLAAETAQALWPFTTTRASGDSLSGLEWEERFNTWRERPISLREAAPTRRISVADSLQQFLESQNIQLSASELARMVAMAEQQTPQSPPAPGTPFGPPASPGAQRTPPDSLGAATRADSAAARAGAPQRREAPETQAVADSLGSPSDPFASLGDSTSAFPGSGAPGDSLGGDVGGGTGVSGPTSPTLPQAPDPAAAAALVGKGVAPAFNSRFTSSNDRMSLNSSLGTTVADVSGFTLTSALTYGDILSLTQNTETQNSAINFSALFPLPRYGLTFNMSTNNSRSDRVGRSITNARTRNQSEDQAASFSAQGARDLRPGLRANAFFARRHSQNDQLIEATAGANTGDRQNKITGNSFGFGANVTRIRWMTIRGRYGHSSNDNLDRSASFVTDDNPAGEQNSTSVGDTANVNVTIPRAGWFSGITLDFSSQESEDSFTDVARTASGGRASDTDFALETKRNFSRSLRARGILSPFRGLSADLSVAVRRDSVSYKLRPNQFKDDNRFDWSIGASYQYMTGGSVRVTYEAQRNDIDQDELSNPENPQTRREESRSLSVSLNQTFSQTFNARVYGDISLAQGFYSHEGPQGLGDRDDSRTRLGLELNGQISSKATARVQMYVRTYDQAFIDVRRSGRSRNETEYVVRPSFTYNITPDLTLEQFYGLSSKVLDEIYNPTRNTLNRNHFLQTRMRYVMTSRFEFVARWEYLLQDNGFYVDNPRTPQDDRIFAPSARTKKDEVGVAMRYALIKDGVLTFTSENVATREHSGVRIKTVQERGNLALGLDSQINIGSLRLNTRASRNQSFNVTLNRNVFYNVDSSLSYAF